MPAASHLAIHFRDDCRSEPDPATAGRLTLRSVAVPIIWTAITGAIGYGALITSDVVPIQQFGAILGICTLCAAILVMIICPIAMLPPFPLEIPVKEGSDSRVAAAMHRLTDWVFHHPGAIVTAVAAAVVPLSLGMFNLTYETNYINLFRPETRVVKDYKSVESKLGGIGLVEVVVPIGKKVSPPALAQLGDVGRKISAIPVDDPTAISQVLSLATVLDPDQRIGALPEEVAGPHPGQQGRADLAVSSVAALADLLESGDRRHPVADPVARAAAGPDQGAHLHRGRERGPVGVRPLRVSHRALVPDDPDDPGGHRHPVDHFFLVGPGDPDHAHPGVSEPVPGAARHPADDALRGAGAGPHGVVLDQAGHGHGAGGQRGAGAVGGRYVPLPDPVSPRAEGAGLPREPLRQLQGLRSRRHPLQPGCRGRVHGTACQRVCSVRQLRHDGGHRHGGEHAGQSRAAAGVPDPGPSVGRAAIPRAEDRAGGVVKTCAERVAWPVEMRTGYHEGNGLTSGRAHEEATMNVIPALLIVSLAAWGDPPRSDLDMLQGTWVMASMETEGHEAAPEDIKDLTAVYDGNRLTLAPGIESGGAGIVTLAADRTPRAINTWDQDGPYADQTVPGIYELKGDTLRLAFARPGEERPKEFTTKSGTAFLVCVYKRQNK